MPSNTINASDLARLFLSAAANLDQNKDWINELNVFPVPDGDTGTNMTMTIMSAAKDVAAIPASDIDMMSVCKAISTGSLRGARGNSGVILSQLLRGLTKEIRDHKEVDTALLSSAFHRAVETAYKAVMKPKEGTILTVAKGMDIKAAQLLAENPSISLGDMLEAVIKEGDVVLDHTPELLPVLKQAGVVDSGGQGLMCAMKGAYDAFLGKDVQLTIERPKKSSPIKIHVNNDVDTANIRFGYCTEFIVLLESPLPDSAVAGFKAYLESIGDSIVCVADEEYIKVHVHTNDPGLAFQKALTYGQLDRMKIDNMRLEHKEKVIRDAETVARELREADMFFHEGKPEPPREHKPFGFLSVSVGEGLAEIFTSLGADRMISGGQTMNPSTDDFLQAAEDMDCDTIFVLPNNKNIILAAQQAAKLIKNAAMIVIPTTNIPQGISAMIAFNPDADARENEAAMNEAISAVASAQITYAVRNTSVDGFTIKEKDIMGIGDKHILSVGNDITTTTMDTLSHLMNDEATLISIYYGEDIPAEDADHLKEMIALTYPSCDIDLHSGGQPVYYYILSVE